MPRFLRSTVVSAWLAVWLACTTGCLSTRVNWADPDFANPRLPSWKTRPPHQDTVELRYAEAVRLETKGCSKCVDLYFEVAVATRCHDGPKCPECRKRRLHKSALKKLVATGQRFGRLDPRSGIQVHFQGHKQWIPITHHGFVWERDWFQALELVGEYSTNGFRTRHQSLGVGIPLVVTGSNTTRQPFLDDEAIFSATLHLNIGSGVETASIPSQAIRLELYDPLRVDRTVASENQQVIVKDLSASLAFRLRDENQTIIEDFINPGRASGDSRIVSAEPYQPGKIPIVLIHGLLSNPFTWADMANDLRAYPGFVEHYQLCVFEYPTGQPFLTSAAQLRAGISALRIGWDPHQQDPQLSKMVLVGHSMGGLIAKLQVTESGNQLWRSIAKRPFNEVRMGDFARQQLRDAFFFPPSPHVSRVVFMGTPHRGSPLARRCIGRIGARLVNAPDDRRLAYQQLIRLNPGVFTEEVQKRIPTSIDLLDPDSRLLQTIAKLPIEPCVQMHSVIGTKCCTLLNGKSDGVVPVKSAIEPRAISERRIKTTHGRLNDHPEAIEEVIAILNQHAWQSIEPIAEPVGHDE
ncbi:MAG: hypothetical protein AAGG48_13350 [Planctomycetota bacterium]